MFDVFFLGLLDGECFVASVDVQHAMSREGGFGHEENDENEHEYESSTHTVHSYTVGALLYDRSG
jgi:hypothetical protein